MSQDRTEERKAGAVHWYDILAVVALIAALANRAAPGTPWDGPKIAAVFVLMIALIRRGFGVGVVLLICAPVLGRLFALSWGQTASTMTFGIFDPDARALHLTGIKAFGLGLAVFLPTSLGVLLVESKVMKGFILAAEDLIRDVRWIAAAVPAMIGLLPMPGGAMLSAPIVGEVSERLELDGDAKTFTNYWFRHVWEYCWPLYPALVFISTQIEGATLVGLFVRHAPLSAAAITLGVVAILVPMKKSRDPISAFDGSRFAAILWALGPVAAIVIVFAIVGRWVSGHYQVYVLAGTALAVILVFALLRRTGAAPVLKAMRKSLSIKLALLVFGVYVMRAMFETSGAGAHLPGQLASAGVPVPVTIFAVPFTMGLLTGYCLAAVATTFPLIKELLDGSAANIMLAYAGAFFGILLSPVHLCLVLTREYFSASWRRVYGRVLVFVGIMFAFTVALYIVYLKWL